MPLCLKGPLRTLKGSNSNIILRSTARCFGEDPLYRTATMFATTILFNNCSKMCLERMLSDNLLQYVFKRGSYLTKMFPDLFYTGSSLTRTFQYLCQRESSLTAAPISFSERILSNKSLQHRFRRGSSLRHCSKILFREDPLYQLAPIVLFERSLSNKNAPRFYW